MNAFLVHLSGCLLAILWLFGVLRLSESAMLCTVEPENPKNVVLGVNSKTVSLNWETCRGDDGETIDSLIFKRQRPEETVPEVIASRPGDGVFTMRPPFADFKKYRARLDQELQIFNVQVNEEYVYTLEINYRTSTNVIEQKTFQVTVKVKVPPQITTAPRREVQLTLSSSSVQNYTLTCNASGDPHPNITWSKDGVPESQFNASGYLLHLVDVQKKDAGSYICTASNGFGDDVTAIGILNIRCTDCKTEKVGITIELSYKQPFGNQISSEFKDLESRFLSAIWGAYASNPDSEIKPYSIDVVEFRDGSVYAIVELKFGSSVSDPLKPLRDEMNDGKLGSFTVNRQLVVNPTDPSTTKPTETTTGEKKEDPSAGAQTSGLAPEIWGVIGACIAVVIIVAIVIIVCCMWKRKGKSKNGASKGGKSTYSEADGYRMNRQPPPSGLGTASPAYVEASQYAKRKDDQSKPPLNYAEVSFNNSSGPGRQPPPYSRTEYSEMSPEKQPPQKGEGGGFELWC